jgi:hypothetical protein
LFGGDMDMTEEGCKLMATLSVVINSLGNLDAMLLAASAHYGVKAADYTLAALRCCGRWSSA